MRIATSGGPDGLMPVLSGKDERPGRDAQSVGQMLEPDWRQSGGIEAPSEEQNVSTAQATKRPRRSLAAGVLLWFLRLRSPLLAHLLLELEAGPCERPIYGRPR